MSFRVAPLFACLAFAGWMLPATAQAQPDGKIERKASPRGSTLGRAPGVTSRTAPDRAAWAWLQSRQGLKPPGSSLSSSEVDRIGSRRRVRFQESYGGVPVLGGESVVVLGSTNQVLAASSETLPGSPPSDLSPALSKEQATRIAFGLLARSYGKQDFDVQEIGLQIFDPRIFGAPGLPKSRLVWQLHVRGENYLNRLILIDAQMGFLVLNIDQNHQALDRAVCNAGNAEAKYPCTSSDYARIEGGAATGDTDTDAAYDLSGGVYNFYHDLFGRDSIDGAGMKLVSTTNFCFSACPYENAFWDGTQMVYGPGFASADDVVGHELTHGVTEKTSALIYYYQSGAINEAMSDIMGELFDLGNGVGSDGAGDRWKMGEDLPGSVGIIRDMKNPPAYGQPDRMNSGSYYGGSGDNGGVHYNSGIANKAAYLLTDGDTFNGRVVEPIGSTKTAKLFYYVNTQYLRTGSDYYDLAQAMRQACTDNPGVFSLLDCQQIEEAIQATEMDQDNPVAGATHPAQCTAPGHSVYTMFHDDFSDNASAAWTTQNIGWSANQWYYNNQSNPWGFDSTWSGDNHNLWAYNRGLISDNARAMTGSVHVGPDSYLRVKHAYSFDWWAGVAYDGGVIEYSTDDGATWHDLGQSGAVGGYNGTLASAQNPLNGRSAFTGDSKGLTTGRWSLADLEGQDVRFRFRLASDELYSALGWFIDDVSIYDCQGDHVPPQTTIQPLSQSYVNQNPASISISFSADETSTFQCKLDSGSWSGCSSPKVFSGLTQGQHTVYVQATDSVGNQDATPAEVSFHVDWTAPHSAVTRQPDSINTGSMNFQVEVDEPISALQCRLDSGSWSSCPVVGSLSQDNEVQYSGLSHGVHSVEVRAVDPYSNTEGSPYGVAVSDTDLQGPGIMARSVPAYVRAQARFKVQVFEQNALLECRLDNGVWNPCLPWGDYRTQAGNVSLSLGRNGRHTLRIRAVDALNNYGEVASYIIYMDNIVPALRVYGSSTTRASRPWFRIQSNESVRLACRIDRGIYKRCSGRWRPLPVRRGRHTLEVRAVDRAGNVKIAQKRFRRI